MDKSDDSDQSSHHLRNLNKLSHKISKPNLTRHRQQQPQHDTDIPPPDATATPPDAPQQPPVYNINKNDFREVVQKLTGSPSHPPSAPPPKPNSSRLHRIRPPPLAQVAHQPLPLLNASNQVPMSPLPPFPSVHAAAESPISAYLRFFQSAPPLMPQSPLAFSGFPQFPVSPVPSPGESAN